MKQLDISLVNEAAKIYKVLSNSRRISILFFYAILLEKLPSLQSQLILSWPNLSSQNN